MFATSRKVELDKADDLLHKSKPSCPCWQHHEVTHNGRFHGMIPLPLIFLFLELRQKLGVFTLGIAALRWFEKCSPVAEERYVSDNWPIARSNEASAAVTWEHRLQIGRSEAVYGNVHERTRVWWMWFMRTWRMGLVCVRKRSIKGLFQVTGCGDIKYSRGKRAADA